MNPSSLLTKTFLLLFSSLIPPGKRRGQRAIDNRTNWGSNLERKKENPSQIPLTYQFFI